MAKGAAVGIMCKAPRLGRSKSRLAAAVGTQAAAELSGCFPRDVAAAIEAVPSRCACRGYGVCAPAGSEDELRQYLPPSFGLLLQVDTDFGNVLHGAMRDLLAAEHGCVALVNGDSPTLPPQLLVDAIDALRRPSDSLVLGLASDGGYYLIGLKYPHRRLFEDIPWGTETVCRLTVQRAAEVGLEVVAPQEWYDVDNAETFAWRRAEIAGRSDRFKEGGAAAATRAWLAVMAGTAP